MGQTPKFDRLTDSIVHLRVLRLDFGQANKMVMSDVKCASSRPLPKWPLRYVGWRELQQGHVFTDESGRIVFFLSSMMHIHTCRVHHVL